MRWIFLSLLILNGLVFSVQWLEYQKSQAKEIVEEQKKGGRTLTLLGEINSQGKKIIASGDQANNDEKVEELCLLVGPLDDKSQAEELSGALDSKDIDVNLFTNTVSLAPEYWVYLPPMESRKAAIAQLRELQVKQIDSFLISQGGLRNGISLGLFRNVDSAQRLLAKRRDEGYPAELREVPRQKDEFWVVSNQQVSSQISSQISKVIKQLALQVEKRQIFCKGVATANKLP